MAISLCMIVKDEEKTLARCLDSVKEAVDEIVIVDTGSTDGTPAIAKRYTDKIYTFPWTDDFAAARNFSFSKGTGEYLMWLDADDVLPDESREALIKLKAKLLKEQPNIVYCPYESGGLVYDRERLIRRNAHLVWEGRVHECIAPNGSTLRTNVQIKHLGSDKPRADRNLKIYQRQIDEGVPLSPRDTFYYGRELYYHKKYREAVETFRPILVRGAAWYVNQIEACRIAAKCYAALGEKDEAIKTLLSSFLFGDPRAGILCDIGDLFFERKEYARAIFFYSSALTCPDHTAEGDFTDKSDLYLRPMLGLTSAHFFAGNKQKSLSFHKLLYLRYPDHPSVQYNRAFFHSQKLL